MMIKAAIIGSGNIAHHFLPALLSESPIFITCLHSRNEKVGLKLCRNNKIAYAKSLKAIPKNMDIIFIMTNDDSIVEVSRKLSSLQSKETVLLHFSGILGLHAFNPYFANVANVWSIYSVSKADRNLDLNKMPICITSSNSDTLNTTMDIFSPISAQVVEIDNVKKDILHLGAVMANNFTNHIFTLTKKLMDENNLDFDLLKPIIQQTFAKIEDMDPSEIQTGPAARRDNKSIEKHLSLLDNDPELREIYQVLTQSIINNS